MSAESDAFTSTSPDTGSQSFGLDALLCPTVARSFSKLLSSVSSLYLKYSVSNVFFMTLSYKDRVIRAKRIFNAQLLLW